MLFTFTRSPPSSLASVPHWFTDAVTVMASPFEPVALFVSFPPFAVFEPHAVAVSSSAVHEAMTASVLCMRVMVLRSPFVWCAAVTNGDVCLVRAATYATITQNENRYQ